METKKKWIIMPPYAPNVVNGIYSIRHKVTGVSVSGDICCWDKELSKNTAEFIIKACNTYQSLALKAVAERWHFVLDNDQIAILRQFQEHLAKQGIIKTERETFDLIFREFASLFFEDEEQLDGKTVEDLLRRLRDTSLQHYVATRRGEVTLHASPAEFRLLKRELCDKIYIPTDHGTITVIVTPSSEV
jgi:hypothetical protein